MHNFIIFGKCLNLFSVFPFKRYHLYHAFFESVMNISQPVFKIILFLNDIKVVLFQFHCFWTSNFEDLPNKHITAPSPLFWLTICPVVLLDLEKVADIRVYSTLYLVMDRPSEDAFVDLVKLNIFVHLSICSMKIYYYSFKIGRNLCKNHVKIYF